MRLGEEERGSRSQGNKMAKERTSARWPPIGPRLVPCTVGRGRTGATCGGLQVREGGEGREETKPPLGLERFLGFLSFPRSSREEFALSSWIWTTHHPPQGERKRVWGDSKLFYCFFLVCRVELILSRGLIDEDCEIFWLMRDDWLNVFECLVISFLFFF